MTTLTAVPCARAVVGKISVGMSHTVANQPIPKFAVAMNKAIVPGMETDRIGIDKEVEDWARPEKSAKRRKQRVRPMDWDIIRERRPMASMSSQANVIVKR